MAINLIQVDTGQRLMTPQQAKEYLAPWNCIVALGKDGCQQSYRKKRWGYAAWQLSEKYQHPSNAHFISGQTHDGSRPEEFTL